MQRTLYLLRRNRRWTLALPSPIMSIMGNEEYHWTEELFEKRPDLFMGAFEARIGSASDEVDTLLLHLREQGYQPENILDLNCGIGRHAVELGQRGIHVLGTDISSHYVEAAQEKARAAGVGDRVRFRVADMRQIASSLANEEPFDGIICLWTSFGFYDDETNAAILNSCLRLVHQGGFFALDIVNRDWLLQNYAQSLFSRSKDMIVLQEAKFDQERSRNCGTWTFLKKTGESTYTLESTIHLDHRVWSLHELISLFEDTGWRFKAVYPGLSTLGFVPKTLASSSQEGDVLKSPMMLAISCRP